MLLLAALDISPEYKPPLFLVTQADEDNKSEDHTYNSFQYWRAPLPELDLSLLEDDHSQTKDKSKVKDSSSVAMET